MRINFSRSTSCLITMLAALALGAPSAFSQSNSPPPPSNSAPAQPETKPAAPANNQPKAPSDTSPAPETKPTAPAEGGKTPSSQDQLVYVQVKTSKGDFVLELNRAKAPITVENFVGYVDRKFYDGTVIHRIVNKPPTQIAVIQGGGFTKDLVQKATEQAIKNEWTNGLKNNRGTISMARTNAPDSATSQFFINTQDNPLLDTPQGGAAYAVFGRVIAGMGVVDTIQGAKTGTNAKRMPDSPVESIVVESATRISSQEAQKALMREKAEKKKAEPPAEKKPNAP